MPDAATTKGLIIHTAFDAGNVGPDYSTGWGVVNGADAANFLTNALGATPTNFVVTDTFNAVEQVAMLTSDGTSPIKATLVWTDPSGAAVTGGIDDATSVLVNDIDIYIEGPGGTYFPWTLSLSSPSSRPPPRLRRRKSNLRRPDQPWKRSTRNWKASARISAGR